MLTVHECYLFSKKSKQIWKSVTNVAGKMTGPVSGIQNLSNLKNLEVINLASNYVKGKQDVKNLASNYVKGKLDSVLTNAKNALGTCVNSSKSLVTSTSEAVQLMKEDANKLLNKISSQESEAYKIKDPVQRKKLISGLKANKKTLGKKKTQLKKLNRLANKENSQKLKNMKQHQRDRRNKKKALNNRKKMGVNKLMGVMKKPANKRKLSRVVRQVNKAVMTQSKEIQTNDSKSEEGSCGCKKKKKKKCKDKDYSSPQDVEKLSEALQDLKDSKSPDKLKQRSSGKNKKSRSGGKRDIKGKPSQRPSKRPAQRPSQRPSKRPAQKPSRSGKPWATNKKPIRTRDTKSGPRKSPQKGRHGRPRNKLKKPRKSNNTHNSKYTPQRGGQRGKANRKSSGKSSTPSGQKIAETCLSSFMDSIPPSFCWKKGADFGKIPTDCPRGYHREMALCYKTCKNGYSHWGGICWEECNNGRENCGAVCGRGSCWKFWTWRAKKSYIPRSITNFHEDVGCGKGMYKSGSLCYRDCNKIGLTNCGIGACSADASSCIKGIISIAIDFLTSLVTFIGFIASFGAAGALSSSIKSAGRAISNTVKKMSDQVKKATKIFRRINTNKNAKKSFIDKVTAKAKSYLAQEFKGKAVSMVADICSQVGDNLMTKVQEPPKQDFDIENFDPVGALSAMKTCKSAGKSDTNKMECTGAILDIVSQVDPTGLAGMASAFMKPICDV
jgi:hypothetical protein